MIANNGYNEQPEWWNGFDIVGDKQQEQYNQDYLQYQGQRTMSQAMQVLTSK